MAASSAREMKTRKWRSTATSRKVRSSLHVAGTRNQGPVYRPGITGDNAARRAEDIGSQELSYAEVKAIASGNPAVLTLAEADAELQRLALLKKNTSMNNSSPAVASVICRE